MTAHDSTVPVFIAEIFPDTEMGRLCRAKDWAATPLGPVSGWPVSLRTASAMVLRQGLPQALCWGPSLHQIYNDGYRLILGDKHPDALGTPVLESVAGVRASVFGSSSSARWRMEPKVLA